MIRTRAEMERRTIGLKWLQPHPTLEELCVGVWLEENGLKGQYIFQALVGGYRAPARADFLMLCFPGNAVFQVQGDYFHEDTVKAEFDRQQRLIMEEQGITVIELWGHDIIAYEGFDAPSDESFDRMMRAAMSLQQISFRYG